MLTYYGILLRILLKTDLNSLDISNIMLSLHKFQNTKIRLRRILKHMTCIIEAKLQEIQPLHLKNVLTGLILINGRYFDCSRIIKLIFTEITDSTIIFKMNPVMNSALAYSLTKLTGYIKLPRYILWDLEDKFNISSRYYNTWSVATLSWSFAKLKYLPSFRFHKILIEYLASNLHNFTLQGIFNVIYALAIFGRPIDEHIKQKIITFFHKNAIYLSMQHKCIFLWSLAILDALDSEMLKFGLECLDLERSIPNRKMKDIGIYQIVQCIIHVKIRKKENIEISEKLKSILKSKIRVLYDKVLHTDTQNRSVRDRLKSVGFMTLRKFNEKYGRPENDEFELVCHKMINRDDKMKLAVQVHHPGHFFVNRTKKLTGPMQWMEDTLRAEGYTIFDIDKRNWPILKHNQQLFYVNKRVDEIKKEKLNELLKV